jgi:hypothetical protein
MTLRLSSSSRRRLMMSSLPIESSARVMTGFRHAELAGEPAHGVRRRLKVHGEQDRQLPQREVGRLFELAFRTRPSDTSWMRRNACEDFMTTDMDGLTYRRKQVQERPPRRASIRS